MWLRGTLGRYETSRRPRHCSWAVTVRSHLPRTSGLRHVTRPIALTKNEILVKRPCPKKNHYRIARAMNHTMRNMDCLSHGSHAATTPGSNTQRHMCFSENRGFFCTCMHCLARFYPSPFLSREQNNRREPHRALGGAWSCLEKGTALSNCPELVSALTKTSSSFPLQTLHVIWNPKPHTAYREQEAWSKTSHLLSSSCRCHRLLGNSSMPEHRHGL